MNLTLKRKREGTSKRFLAAALEFAIAANRPEVSLEPRYADVATWLRMGAEPYVITDDLRSALKMGATDCRIELLTGNAKNAAKNIAWLDEVILGFSKDGDALVAIRALAESDIEVSSSQSGNAGSEPIKIGAYVFQAVNLDHVRYRHADAVTADMLKRHGVCDVTELRQKYEGQRPPRLSGPTHVIQGGKPS